MEANEALTDDKYWDKYWSGHKLPSIVGFDRRNQLLAALLKVFDRFLCADAEKSILEIGGAPGQYLAYFAREYGFKVSALDYSATGCEIIRKNFELLGFDVTVYQQDLRLLDGTIPLFDIVYSLGVIEHFIDPGLIIAKHLDLLKPGGLLIIGVPYFIRVFSPIIKMLAPRTMATHYLSSIDMRNWAAAERRFNLHILFKDYVGGFEPVLIKSVIEQELQYGDAVNTYPRKIAVSILEFYDKVRWFIRRRVISYDLFAKMNSRFSSAYALAIYRKPA